MRLLLEGPFCRVWYLKERLTCQNLGHADPRILYLSPPLMRTANDITDRALIDHMMLGKHADVFYVPGDYTVFLWSYIMLQLTEGVALVVRVVDTPATSDALANATSAVRGPAPPASDVVLPFRHPALSITVTFHRLDGILDERPLKPLGQRSLVLAPKTRPYPEMGFMDQCLELINTLMVIVRRRETTLVSAGIEHPLLP